MMVSTAADAVYTLFNTFLTLGTLVFVVVMGYMLYHLVKHVRAKEVKGKDVELGELPPSEGLPYKLLISIVLSATIVITLIFSTFSTLVYLETPPADSLEIRVTAFQWGWEFTYPSGKTVLGEARVPINRPIKFYVTSRDVFHKFGVLSLGIGIDAIPGKINTYWTVIKVPGTYEIRCFELCGTGHGTMIGRIVAVTEQEFKSWYEGGG
jgi:cytochrome c oxidase subunit 2